jgi:hypothetical protein
MDNSPACGMRCHVIEVGMRCNVIEVGMMCYTLAVGMKLGVVVILSLRRISRLQLDTTKILRAYPQNFYNNLMPISFKYSNVAS